MKNIKKLGLVSFLACACLTGGIMMANTEAPVEPVKEFKMVEGAQVRVPDVVEDEYVKDGLRFTATMTDAFWQEKGAMENLAVGMFIMPADYATKPINYENCFGADACYYWGEYDGETDGKKEILHVESYAYEEVAGADYLTMKASIWNLNAENLDREFVAVAYLTDGTNYWFAETAQGAKTVSAAQKALLNDNDPIYEVENGAALVEDAYVNAYLGEEGKEVSYTEIIYKQQKDGSYVQAEEVEKTGVVKAYNTQAPASLENYVLYTRDSGDRTILIDGSAEITSYYNYSANRVVLWDGDENLSDSSYVHKQNGEFAMKVAYGTYEGNSARMYDTQGYEGPWWTTGKTLPAAVSTFSFIMEMGKNPDTGEDGVYTSWIPYLYSTAAKYHTPTSMTFENLVTGEVTEVEGDTTDVPTGFYKVTMNFAEAYSSIYGFGFRVQMDPGFPIWYMDNLCAENVVALENFTLPYTFADTVSFDAPEVFDTNAWEGETASITVSYKAEGTDGWSDLTAEDGIYSFAAETGVSRYDVKVVAGDTEFVRTTIKGTVWADFDSNLADRDYVAADTYNSTGLWDSTEKTGFVVSVEGFEGKFMTAVTTNAWMYIHFKDGSSRKTFDAVNGGVAPTKMGAWIYAPKAFTFNCASRIWGRYNYGVGSFEVQAGYHYYEIGLPEGWGTKAAMTAFVISAGEYYVDAVVVY